MMFGWLFSKDEKERQCQGEYELAREIVQLEDELWAERDAHRVDNETLREDNQRLEKHMEQADAALGEIWKMCKAMTSEPRDHTLAVMPHAIQNIIVRHNSQRPGLQRFQDIVEAADEKIAQDMAECMAQHSQSEGEDALHRQRSTQHS